MMIEFLIVMFVVCGFINCVTLIINNNNSNPLKTFVQQQNLQSFITENKVQIIDQGPEKYADTSAIRNRFMSMIKKD